MEALEKQAAHRVEFEEPAHPLVSSLSDIKGKMAGFHRILQKHLHRRREGKGSSS